MKYILETTVFVAGAVVMIFELVGSRVIGPYFGTSISVWTSLIGIILGSLSLGYYLGGKIADKKPDLKTLSLIIFLASISIGLAIFIKDPLLLLLQIKINNLKLNSILASLILFLPTSLLLGMVSPYAAKLKIINLKTSGQTVGNLYAISTAGSIIGTFLAGFYLIPFFGTNKLLLILSLTLFIIFILLSIKQSKKQLWPLIIIGSVWIIIIAFYLSFEKPNFIDIDTAYNRIWIYETKDPQTNKLARLFSINKANSSAMFLNDDELVFEYTKYYHLAKHFNPNFKTALMIGGAGYSYPKEYLKAYPKATIDVVEIDPMVTELAKKYFNLNENPRLKIYHQDGRVFLNKSQKKYDVIFGDAFSSPYSLPYQLTTKETVQRKYDLLNNNGVVILNLIAAIEGTKGEFTRAEYRTYKSVFPRVYLFPVHEPNDGQKFQNIILVALKSKNTPSFSSNDPKLNEYLKHLWTKKVTLDMPILTDDYAPVDYYIDKLDNT